MIIDKASYDKLFATKFWSKLNESIVPFDDKPIDKDPYLDSLYNQIQNFTYLPSHPREYIVYNKHNGISRYVPTFKRKDYCVYYLCVKLLENEIAINRVEGTYGGWTLGNPIRLKEEQELLELDYIPFNTINELSWATEWRSFQGIARKFKEIDDFKYFINLDIANFYDTINLTILERKLRHIVPKNKQDVVSLLMHFLQGWNKRLEGYSSKTIGIPQDEIGDISRILANFYLQDYDKYMYEICEKYGAKFIRFADDQIIFAKSKEDARKILFEASKHLFKINLNLNSGKVKEFDSKQTFDQYWAFEIFDLLQAKEDREKINEAIRRYFELTEQNIRFRDYSVLKRLLSIDIDLISAEHKHKILSIYYNIDLLSTLDLWHFRRIRQLANNDEEFFGLLDSLIPTALFNSYHYQLLRFYTKDRDSEKTVEIRKRISEIKP
ncbi:MAG: RNA-directed DNA polymerase [Bacteroidales bacterium]|nr:RNA-directed DNA polymerase [Bacteroidales bacterium]